MDINTQSICVCLNMVALLINGFIICFGVFFICKKQRLSLAERMNQTSYWILFIIFLSVPVGVTADSSLSVDLCLCLMSLLITRVDSLCF